MIEIMIFQTERCSCIEHYKLSKKLLSSLLGRSASVMHLGVSVCPGAWLENYRSDWLDFLHLISIYT